MRFRRLRMRRRHLENLGHQQLLLRRVPRQQFFHALVHHALVRGVHVHQHHALRGLRQNVDAVQLRNGVPQRRRAVTGRGGMAIRVTVTEAAVTGAVAVGLPMIAPGARPGFQSGDCRRLRPTAPPVPEGPIRLVRDAALQETAVRIGTHARRTRVRQQKPRLRGRSAAIRRAAGEPIGRRAARGLRGRPGVGQGALHRTKQEIVDPPRVAEAHLQLLRMGIDIDQRGIQLQIQEVRREAAAEQDVLIGEPRRPRDQLVAHEAAVQEGKLQVRLAARKRRQRQPPRKLQLLRVMPEFDDVGGEVLAANLGHSGQPLGGQARRRQRPHLLPVVRQREAHLEARQRQALQHAHDVLKLGRLGAQEFAARRHVEEQVAHLDTGAGGMRGRRGRRDHAIARLHRPGVRRIRGARNQRQAGHGRDTGQRFAAKPQGRDVLEVVQRGDLAGGMARESDADLLRRDADAVVAHADQAAAAAFQLDLDAPRARVQGVLDQFLDHRGRPFDDLAGGDLIDECVGQDLDGQRATSRIGYFRTARPATGNP